MTTMQQVLYAIVAGVPALILGILAYRRSKKVDAVAQQSGAATESRAGTAQIIEGLNEIIDSLQEDNKMWREDIRYLTNRLDLNDKQREDLRNELVRMHRKYGDNGNGIPASGPIT
jgi:uncharacterized coiled-coil protein SlyX